MVRANYATKQADVTDLEELEGLLSPFQVEKLTYFFNQFFDFNEDGKIDVSCTLHNDGTEFGFIFQFLRRPTLPV